MPYRKSSASLIANSIFSKAAWLNAPSAGSNSLGFFDRRHPIAFHPGIPSQPTFACLQLRPQAETSVLCR
jgi:hypothetical protein